MGAIVLTRVRLMHAVEETLKETPVGFCKVFKNWATAGLFFLNFLLFNKVLILRVNKIDDV